MAVNPLAGVRRAVDVLEAVARHQPVGVAALARHLGDDKSALQRVLVTLDDCGWIQRAPGTPTRWELAARPYVVFGAARNGAGLLGRARPVLESLRDATGETAFLAVPEGDHLVAVDVVESRDLVRTVLDVGFVLPLRDSASGVALLAGRSADETTEMLGGAVDAATRGEIERTRERGWSLNDGVIARGVTSIGAPVCDETGRAVAVVVVCAPTSRLPPDRFDDVATTVVAAAAALAA